jgi:hypothetical protein
MLFLGLGLGCVLCVMCSSAFSVFSSMSHSAPKWQCSDLVSIPPEQSVNIIRNDKGMFTKVYLIRPGKGTWVTPSNDSIFLTVENNRVTTCYIPGDKPQAVECGGVDRIERF